MWITQDETRSVVFRGPLRLWLVGKTSSVRSSTLCAHLFTWRGTISVNFYIDVSFYNESSPTTKLLLGNFLQSGVVTSEEDPCVKWLSRDQLSFWRFYYVDVKRPPSSLWSTWVWPNMVVERGSKSSVKTVGLELITFHWFNWSSTSVPRTSSTKTDNVRALPFEVVTPVTFEQ